MILENPNATTLCSALVSFFIPVIISVIYLGQGYEKKNPTQTSCMKTSVTSSLSEILRGRKFGLTPLPSLRVESGNLAVS